MSRKLSQSAEAVQKRKDRKRAKRHQDNLDHRQKQLSGPVVTCFVDPKTLS